MKNEKILIGNSFPFSLIRRNISVEVITLAEAKSLLSLGYTSYWGHGNTIASAEAILNTSLKPATVRPAVVLDENNYPTLDGITYDKVIILSPEYAPGFRPAIGEEVAASTILNWHILLLTWR